MLSITEIVSKYRQILKKYTKNNNEGTSVPRHLMTVSTDALYITLLKRIKFAQILDSCRLANVYQPENKIQLQLKCILIKLYKLGLQLQLYQGLCTKLYSDVNGGILTVDMYLYGYYVTPA